MQFFVRSPSPLAPNPVQSLLLCQFDIQTVKWQFTLTGNSTELNSNQPNCELFLPLLTTTSHTQKLVTCATQHFRSPGSALAHLSLCTETLSFCTLLVEFQMLLTLLDIGKLDVPAPTSPPRTTQKSNLKWQTAAPA